MLQKVLGDLSSRAERQASEEQEWHLNRNTLHLNSDPWKGWYLNQRCGQEMSGLGWSAWCPLPCKAEPRHWPVPCILQGPETSFLSSCSEASFNGSHAGWAAPSSARGEWWHWANSASGRHWQGAEGRNSWHSHHLASSTTLHKSTCWT